MNPVDLIKRDLGPDEWQRCRQGWADGNIINLQEELSLFRDYKIYKALPAIGETSCKVEGNIEAGSVGPCREMRYLPISSMNSRVLQSEWTISRTDARRIGCLAR